MQYLATVEERIASLDGVSHASGLYKSATASKIRGFIEKHIE
jgi:hypothetical protein